MKIDAAVNNQDATGKVIDYKTGRQRYNQIKHGEQIQLYQLTFLLKHPEIEKLVTELWYVDEGQTVKMNFTRKQGLKFQTGFNKRAEKMFDEKNFKPNANAHSCRFCPYGPGKTYQGENKLNICTAGVECY